MKVVWHPLQLVLLENQKAPALRRPVCLRRFWIDYARDTGLRRTYP